jgi:hypothetical protein
MSERAGKWEGIRRCTLVRSLAFSVAVNALLCGLLVLSRYVATAGGALLSLLIVLLACSLWGLVSEIRSHLSPPEPTQTGPIPPPRAAVTFGEMQAQQQIAAVELLSSRFGELQALAVMSALQERGFVIMPGVLRWEKEPGP